MCHSQRASGCPGMYYCGIVSWVWWESCILLKLDDSKRHGIHQKIQYSTIHGPWHHWFRQGPQYPTFDCSLLQQHHSEAEHGYTVLVIPDAEWAKQMPDSQKSSLKWIKDKVSQLHKQMILQNADLQNGGFDEEVPYYLESLGVVGSFGVRYLSWRFLYQYVLVCFLEFPKSS